MEQMETEGLNRTGAETEQAATLGVYVSVPFCRSKCSFCNFASGVSSAEAIEAYIVRLCREIATAPNRAENLRAHLPRRVDSVYLGGGTPSLLAPAQLRRIFVSLRETFQIAGNAEITLEAAPGQIDDALLNEAMSQGVNRISLGVQSFVDRESAAVGRNHTGSGCVHEVHRLQRAGITDLGVDLIAGLPYQTQESWQQSLRVVTSIGLNHLSVYMLEMDDDSRLGREVLAGGRRLHTDALPSEEITAALYESACEWLPAQGFAQYEISNFAPAQYRSRHNCKYWRRAPYIGFGLDAHSMLLRGDNAMTEERAAREGASSAVRFANPEDLARYMKKELSPAFPMLTRSDEGIVEIVEIGRPEAFEESIFLGLRMTEGVNLWQLRRDFPANLVQPAEEAAAELVQDGLLLAEDGCWRLTLRGRLLSNDVFTRLLMGVAA